MKNLIFIYILFVLGQNCFAQKKSIDVSPLLKNSFLNRSESLLFRYSSHEKAGKLYFLKGSGQFQWYFPSFGYVSTSVSIEEYPSLLSGKGNVLDVSVQQKIGDKILSSWIYHLVQRDEKKYIAGLNSCTDSLLPHTISTVEDYKAIAMLKLNLREGRFQIINDDHSEISFQYFDGSNDHLFDIYFHGREPDSLKWKSFGEVKYKKLRDYNLSELSTDQVIALIKNSLLQNILFTRLLRDTVLMGQLESQRGCTDIDSLPLDIIPSYQEVVCNFEVIPFAWRRSPELEREILPLLTVGNLKRLNRTHATLNGYKIFLLRRPKEKETMFNLNGGRTYYLKKSPEDLNTSVVEEIKTVVDSTIPPPPPPSPIICDEGIATIANYLDRSEHYYGLYLVGFEPEKGKIYFLSGNDITLHPGLSIYRPPGNAFSPFSEWPKRYQMEFIQDKLLSYRPRNLELDEVKEQGNEITGTVSIILEGQRVTKKISVNTDTPYIINFH